MVEFYKHFAKSIRWNTFESLSYQALLLAHQLMLFSVTDYATYGLIGTLFSITYLIVMFTNFGFDVSLTPFFTLASTSKNNFKHIVGIQLIPEYIFLSAIFLSTIIAKSYINHLLPAQCDTSLLITIGCLIIFEGAKKTLRMLLQLAYLNHTTAIIEVATIITYTSIIWCSFGLGYPITPHLVFMPMLFVSAVSTLILGYFVYQYFSTLPNDQPESLPITIQWRILRNRFFNFLNQASHMAFSSNFLVPCFALLFGLNQAGVLKLMSAIAHCITIVVQKVFGISSSILLSRIKDMDAQTKQHAFSMISHKINQVLYAIIIFFIINCSTIMRLNSIPTLNLTWLVAYLFLIISFSENFFLAYEKFYIAHEKANHLFLFNIIVMGALAITLTMINYVSPISLLLTIITIRILAFCSISLLSFYRWHIKPSFRIQPLPFMCALAISIAFFLLAS
jgi:hypothetical protein